MCDHTDGRRFFALSAEREKRNREKEVTQMKAAVIREFGDVEVLVAGELTEVGEEVIGFAFGERVVAVPGNPLSDICARKIRQVLFSEEMTMATTLAFDVYGTLIDTHGVITALQELLGEKAKAFSHTWRDKQLEYSFRRGLMQNYETFTVCTSQALDYTCAYYKIELTEDQKAELLNIYRVLPAFEDVKEGLISLKNAGFRLYAFSNGTADALEILLSTAGIRDLFLGVVSVDDLKSFKPNPGVYSHFLRKSNASGDSAWLISSNSFDVIGAISAGMKSAWVCRTSEAIFDPWEIEPTVTVSSLTELNGKVS
jgi:2-haloacid dehalogenase